jgi:transposase
MDAHREWIDVRVAEGRINASKLHGELVSRGVRLSYATVRRYLTKPLGRAGKTRSRVNAAKTKPAPPPSHRQLSFDWVRRLEKRPVEAQARLDTIRAASPELTIALDLADEFMALIRKRSTGKLADRLSRAEVSPCPEVRHFAEGIRRDESTVDAAVGATAR